MRYGNQIISSIKLGSQIIINKIMKGFEVIYETWRKITKKGTSSVVLTDCKYSIPRLPEEYQEVEYIEATGTQYIDMKYTYKTNDEINIDFMTTTDNTGSIQGIFGNGNLSEYQGVSLYINKTSNPAATIGGVLGSDYQSSDTFVIEKNIKYSVKFVGNTVFFGDTPIIVIDKAINNGTQEDFSLFRRWGTNTLVGRIYKFNIKRNEEFVFNLVPCYRKSDNVIGMYDLVNDVFYENGGTETFLKGKNIAETVYALDYKISGNSYTYGGLPIDYQQVEYIQTTGTQYIDSGVPLKSGLKTIVDWVYANANSGNSYTGGHVGSSPGNRWLIGSQKQNNEYFFGVGSMNVSTLIQFGNRDIVEACWQNKGSYIKINGVEPANAANIANSALEEAPDYTFYMGGLNRDGNINLLPKLIIYGWKFYQDDVLIRDYIPCYRKSDNEIGLYDLVENKFYTNNGTDTLLKGNDILPTPEAPIKIESVGEKTNNLLDERLLGQEEGYNTYENGMWTTSDLGSYGRDIFYNAAGTNHNVDINKVPKVTPNTTITVKFYDYINNDIDMTYTLYIGLYDSEGTYISRNTVNPSNVFTIEIPENVHYISFFRSSNYGTISFSHIQVVEGSYTETTIPEYEPYGYKIPVKVSDELENETTINIYLKKPLRKIGEYADYMNFENQKAITLVDRKTFDGTENWELHTDIAGGCVFRLDGVLTPLLNALQTSTHMTHFALTNTYSTSSFTPGVYRLSSNDSVTVITGSRLYVSSTHATIDEFKEWLAINKPTLCYPLETSEEIDEEFLPIKITSSEMNIQILTDISPSEIEVTYLGKE